MIWYRRSVLGKQSLKIAIRTDSISGIEKVLSLLYRYDRSIENKFHNWPELEFCTNLDDLMWNGNEKTYSLCTNVTL